MSPETILLAIEVAATVAFALSGILEATRRRMDIVGVFSVAFASAFGGGTLRDLLLDAPVFWVENEIYLVVCIAIGALMWFVIPPVERLSKPLRWVDAMGLAAYSVMGAAKTLSLGHPPTVAVLMGVATATFGGIIRDTIAGQPSALLKPELYLTPAFVGAGVYVGLFSFGIEAWPAAIAGVAVAFFLRGGAILKGWHLPGYTPPRDES